MNHLSCAKKRSCYGLATYGDCKELSASIRGLGSSMTEESQKPLDRHAWNVLIIVTIFWIADGYDTFVLLITARPTLHDILPPEALPQFSTYLGVLVAITLAGWATGGILGG